MSLKISRRDFMKTISMGSLAMALQDTGCTRTGTIHAKRPNILFIMSDDHPNSALSCYGGKVNTTPNIDRLAKEGMRFDHAYVTTSLCSPSRASILTGNYPHINGQVCIPKLFDGNLQTFPKLLQAGGYETAIIGKWHLSSEPTGFDYWNVLIGQGPYFNPPMVKNGALRNYNGYTTDIITDICLNWLKNRDNDKPFCLLCHNKAPHYVWEPDEKHTHIFDDTVFPEPDTFNDTHEGRVSPRESDLNVGDMHKHFLYKKWPGAANVPSGLSSEQIKQHNYQEFLKDVLGCIASVDDNVGRLLDFLEDAGLSENTIVVYTSDNGYFLGEHGWFDKKVIYDKSIRIPLLVRYPNGVTPSSVNDDFVLNIDFAPTFLDYAGIAIPSDVQGRSIRPLLDNRVPGDWRTSIYYQIYHANKGFDRRLPHYGIRTRRYKLAYWYREIHDWELYDLEKDPNELKNVYNDPFYTDVVTSLKTELKKLRDELGITDELDQEFAEKTMSNFWAKERNEYRTRKMEEWKRNAAGEM